MLKYLFYIALFASLLLAGCEEEIVPPEADATFTVSLLRVPDFLDTRNGTPATAMVRVTHPDGTRGIQTAVMRFVGPQGNLLLELPLYDDGGARFPGDGDVLAEDGIFSNTFSPDVATFPAGALTIQALVTDNAGSQLESETAAATAVDNTAPVILDVSAPDSVSSGISAFTISATVQDSNAVDDIRYVQLQIRQTVTLRTDTLFLDSELGVDRGVFSRTFDGTFSASLRGSYTLVFQAIDGAGSLSGPLSRDIFLDNSAPSLSDLQTPDSLQSPSSGVTTALISIRAADPQGATDIDSVFFNSVLPNGNPSSNNPFVMRDNGLPFNPNGSINEAGDLTAGDGIYSITIALPPGTPAGNYTFSFFASDRVGNRTIGPVDTLVVY